MKRAMLVAGIVVALGLLGIMQATAQEPGVSATRTFSPATVPAGGEVTVSIAIAGSYGVGSVVETLPSRFTLVDGSVTPADITPVVSGQKVSFALVGESLFSYRVAASEGSDRITGELVYGIDRTAVVVGEPTPLTVTAAPTSSVTATRTFSPATVPTGGEVTVSIAIAGSYGVGSVVETLPSRFTLVDGSVTPADITPVVSGQKVSFALVGESLFSYRVTASEGSDRITGELVYGIDRTAVVVGEPTPLTVTTAPTSSVTATRTFSPATVPTGGEVTVSIAIAGSYGVGSVVETLPSRFTLVDGSVTPADITPVVSGQKVSFALVGESLFSYRVTASEGSDRITGELVYGIDRTAVVVGEPTPLTVTTAPTSSVTATRTFSPATVPTGGEVTVSIAIAGSYGVGSVVETLPSRFTLVDGSVTPADITPVVSGQKVSFALVGESLFSYRVTASEGSDRITGELVYGIDRTAVVVGEPTPLTVTAAPTSSVTATRTFSPATVPTGGEVTVSIAIAGSYGVGSVVETLPSRFTLVDGSVTPADITPVVSGQKVSFALVGESLFSYRVTASEGSDRITGELVYGIDRTAVVVGEPTPLTVVSSRPTTPPSSGGGFGGGGADTNLAPSFRAGTEATRVVAENASPGTAVGDRVTAFDNDGDSITYSIEGDDASLFAIDQTGQVSVAEGAALDYEAAISHAVTLRVSDGRGKSDTIALTITVTNVEETGTVALSSASPEIGTALTATLADPDGGVSNVAWRWDRSADRTTWITIVGASSATYTPTEADGGQYLRATAAYNDNHGTNKWAHMVSANAVPAAATPTPEPTPTPPPAPTATPAPEPTPTPPPAPTATPAPEPTPTPTPPPPAPTATPAPEPTPTPPPPAPTAAPPPVPTATAAPEPTATPAPPAPTVAPPVLEEDDGGFAVWGIVLIILAGLALVAGVVYWTRMRST